jgi:hypothetical protein
MVGGAVKTRWRPMQAGKWCGRRRVRRTRKVSPYRCPEFNKADRNRGDRSAPRVCCRPSNVSNRQPQLLTNSLTAVGDGRRNAGGLCAPGR